MFFQETANSDTYTLDCHTKRNITSAQLNIAVHYTTADHTLHHDTYRNLSALSRARNLPVFGVQSSMLFCNSALQIEMVA